MFLIGEFVNDVVGVLLMLIVLGNGFGVVKVNVFYVILGVVKVFVYIVCVGFVMVFF